MNCPKLASRSILLLSNTFHLNSSTNPWMSWKSFPNTQYIALIKHLSKYRTRYCKLHIEQRQTRASNYQHWHFRFSERVNHRVHRSIERLRGISTLGQGSMVLSSGQKALTGRDECARLALTNAHDVEANKFVDCLKIPVARVAAVFVERLRAPTALKRLIPSRHHKEKEICEKVP